MSTTVAAAGIFPVEPIIDGVLSQTARALQARLQLGFPLTRFGYAMMPPRVTPASWSKLLQRTPFIGIGWNALNDNKGSGRAFVGSSRWSVYMVGRNQASIEARFFGDSQGPGLFTMVQAAVGLLHGYTIDNVGSVQVTQAANVYAEQYEGDLAMAEINLSVVTSIVLPDVVTAPGDLGLFKKMFATWNLDGEDENTDQIAVGDWSSNG